MAEFSKTNTSGGFVRGFWWNMRVCGDAVFSLWTAEDVTRKEAKKALLKFAEFYEPSDITSIWRTIKGPASE